MFEPRRFRALKLCMNHHLVDLYKFCTQDAPSIRVGAFDLVYTSTSTCINDANLKIYMFEPKRLRALNLCMNHYLADVYKFCTQDAPGHITGPVLVLRHLYICICQPNIKKKSW